MAQDTTGSKEAGETQSFGDLSDTLWPMQRSEGLVGIRWACRSMQFPSVGERSVSEPILRSSETLLFASVTIPDVTRSEINDSSISTANVFMSQPCNLFESVPSFVLLLPTFVRMGSYCYSRTVRYLLDKYMHKRDR